MTQELSKSVLQQLVEQARFGTWVEYHRGDLYIDRSKSRRLNALAHWIYAEYKAGNVHLLRRRHGDHDYSYFAIKR